MTVGERIKSLRKKSGMSQTSFADRIGVSKQSLYKYENNIITNIPFEKIKKIAGLTSVTPSYIMGWDDNDVKTTKKNVTIHVFDHVTETSPDTIEESVTTEEITESLAKTGHFFGLQIREDSMSPTICTGDIVIVRRQTDAESGDTVIASIGSDEATCRRLRKYKDGIELISNNPSYKPFDFSNEEIIDKSVKIIGKVVELRRKF